MPASTQLLVHHLHLCCFPLDCLHNLANLDSVWCNICQFSSGLSNVYESIVITQLSALASCFFILRSSVSHVNMCGSAYRRTSIFLGINCMGATGLLSAVIYVSFFSGSSLCNVSLSPNWALSFFVYTFLCCFKFSVGFDNQDWVNKLIVYRCVRLDSAACAWS